MTTRAHLWLGAMLLSGAATLHAQEPPCGIHTITETVAPIYPPIAKAAHVSGEVMLLITLEHDGSVSNAQVVRGPDMLKKSAIDFVRGWKANKYDGSRACPVTVRYIVSGDTGCGEGYPGTPPTERTQRIDSQHFTVSVPSELTCDPSTTITRRKRFFGIL